MFSHATLIAHRGATLVTRDELAHIEPPEGSDTWQPIKHSRLVDALHYECEIRGIRVIKEEYAVQREGNFIFAALVLNFLETHEFAAALAFRHANDKSEAMKMCAGVNVFICDNMALSGDDIVLHKKHMPGFHVETAISQAFDRYRRTALNAVKSIEELQRTELSRAESEQRLFQIFYRKLLPSRLLRPVADSYFHAVPTSLPTPQTLWGLLNACTLHAKCLTPNANMKAHVRLGRYFGLGGGHVLSQN